MSTESDLLTGELLDEKYRVEAAMGHGGMGSVYRATHLHTKRLVAIKVIRPQFGNDEEFILRFQREAEAAGRLRHPNVVDVTDFGFAKTSKGKIAYLVMEYLDGCTLAELLEHEQRLPLDFAVDILEQTCSAVDEAHRKGIIHRDLKPENIWLEPNRRGGYTVKVLDFGLAKLGNLPNLAPGSAHPSGAAVTVREFEPEFGQEATQMLVPDASDSAGRLKRQEVVLARADSNPPTRLLTIPDVEDGCDAATQILADATTVPDSDSQHARTNALTRVGSVMGTPLYMSPEQFRGEALDSRSDIYSLGVIAYRMLAGETPFVGDMSQLRKMLADAVRPSVREKNRKVPKAAARLITSALAADPADRPESAGRFAAALRARAEGTGAVFRQAFSLYSERFPTFLKLSMLAYAPLAACLGIIYLLDLLGAKEGIAGFIPLFIIGFMGGHLLAYSVISSATVSIVTQLSIAPLRPIDLRLALRALKQRWLSFLTTLLLVSGAVFVVFAVALIAAVVLAVKFVQYTSRVPHVLYIPSFLVILIPALIIAARYSLFAPVVTIEGLRPIKALKRAAALTNRNRLTVAILMVLQLGLPFLLYVLFNEFSIIFSLEGEHQKVGLNFRFTNEFTQLLNAFSTPLISIMTALVYLKARRAGGEVLDDEVSQGLVGGATGSGLATSAPWTARIRSNTGSRG